MTFSDKVKHVRAKLQISQKELAARLDVSYATVNRWESQGIIPTFLVMARFNEFCKQNEISFEEIH